MFYNAVPVDLLGSYGQLISVMYPSDFHLGPRNLKMIDGHKIIRLRKKAISGDGNERLYENDGGVPYTGLKSGFKTS